LQTTPVAMISALVAAAARVGPAATTATTTNEEIHPDWSFIMLMLYFPCCRRYGDGLSQVAREV
jgi:hypothetical protein